MHYRATAYRMADTCCGHAVIGGTFVIWKSVAVSGIGWQLQTSYFLTKTQLGKPHLSIGEFFQLLLGLGRDWEVKKSLLMHIQGVLYFFLTLAGEFRPLCTLAVIRFAGRRFKLLQAAMGCRNCSKPPKVADGS
ncbi:hypothetical protein [Erwinia rhapontici]|uniref:hypothetical protein n=1 Tax=Erwinia rhapontici TaxID=55212 RepID=UPI003BA06291